MPVERRGSIVLDPESQLDLICSQVDDLESSLYTVTNRSQLIKLVDKIEKTEVQLESAAQVFVSKGTFSHQSAISSLEISRVELSTTLSHSRNLKKIMESANELSYGITERVRALDSEKSMIKEIKDYVDNVKTLKSELARACDAIEKEDWLVASKSIYIMKQLPEGLIKEQYVEFKVPSSSLPDLPNDLLSKWVDQLEFIFIDAFSEAAAKRDTTRLTYFFQLFPLIGKSGLGLKCYSKFVCEIISEQSRSIIQNAQNKRSEPEFFAQLLFRLYQTISVIVNQHSKIIKSYYGDDAVCVVLKVIQMESDLQSNLIYETYMESRNIAGILDEIRQYSYPVLIEQIYKINTEGETETEEEAEEEAVELVQVSQIADELSAMLNHWSMYSRFFVVVWNEYAKENNEKKNIFPASLILSSFGTKIQDQMIGHFDTSCTYIIRRTLEKACAIESLGSLSPFLSDSLKFLSMVFKKSEISTSSSLYNLPPEEPPVSSLADDLIIVTNTIMLELLATGELAVIKNMVSNIKRILLNDFLNIIKQRLKSNKLKSTSNLFTKEFIQKIHQSQNPQLEKHADSNSGSRSSTPVGLNVSASDIANTGAMFMRSINAAISYTMTGDGSGDSTMYLIGDDAGIKQYVIYLNTLSMMSTYLTKMVESCLKSFRNASLLIVDDHELLTCRKVADNYNTEPQITIPTDESIRNKIEGLLYSIPYGFEEHSEIIINDSINIIFDMVLKSRVIRLIEDALRDSYIMTFEDSEYFFIKVDKNTNGTTKILLDGNRIVSFIQNWNSLIIPYVTTVATPVADKIFKSIAAIAASTIEQRLWRLENSVTSAGVIKLEQDMSTIISELTKLNYGLRSSFSRCNQIVMIAELEEEEEIAALETPESGIEWKLSPNERSRARRLRINS